MNERIKKLAEQAGYYLYDLTETHDMKTVETDEKDEWTTLEKFAEMIVRECADIALKSGNIANKSIEAKAEADRIYHKIQDHFGD